MVRFPVRVFSRLALGPLFLAGCGGDSSIVDPPAEAGPVAAVTVSPTSGAIAFLGQTFRLQATAKDASGTTVSGVTFTWTSSDPSVVSVDETGLATAVAGGKADVTASAEGFSATAVIRVTGPSDLQFLQATWGGQAVFHDGTSVDSMTVSALGESVVGGAGTRLELVAGSSADARALVILGRVAGIDVRMGLADGMRGTFAVSQGFFDGQGGLSLDSRDRLGNGQKERIRIGDMREQSFDLFIDASADGGNSWEPAWVFHLEKGADAPVVPTDRSPACASPRYQEFDFWTGDWSVTVSGVLNGTNLVEPIASACGIQENWTNTTGGTGISLSMYDHRSDVWTQLWVDSGNGLLELSGGLHGTAMVLEGPRDQSGVVVDRVTWTPNSDGTVRQYWETNTGGSGWVPSFDGLYHPSG